MAEPWPLRAAQRLVPESGGNKASRVAALGRGARELLGAAAQGASHTARPRPGAS